MIGKISFVGLFVVAVLFTADAPATLLLPDSSHYEGSTYYDIILVDGFLRGRIDFAVYDTLGGNEFLNAGYSAPGDGQFIYVYQIFNDYPLSDEAVAYFAILGIQGAPVDGIGAEEDPSTGVEPSDEYFTPSEGVWQFDGGLVYAGEHSWFLVLTSDTDWVPGEYQITTAEDNPFPVPIPEPGMLTLLAIGTAMIIKKRKNSVG